METTILRRAPPLTVLQRNAASNICLKAVMQQFSKRQRTRASLTVTGLALAMKKEGLDFSKASYQVVLELLAENGFGTLKYGKTGKPIALVDIKVTLQSIGTAVLKGVPDLKIFRPAAKFKEIDAPEQDMPKDFIESKSADRFGLSLSILLPGGALTVNCKNKVRLEDFGDFLSDFYTLAHKYEGDCI